MLAEEDMETHSSYSILSSLITKYPRAASSLFQTYNDIVYAQQWTDVQVLNLECCSRGAIKGKKPDTNQTLYIVPCSLAETISFTWLQGAFALLFPQSPDRNGSEASAPPFIFLAIASSDASIVYYKLSQGIVKPPV